MPPTPNPHIYVTRMAAGHPSGKCQCLLQQGHDKDIHLTRAWFWQRGLYRALGWDVWPGVYGLTAIDRWLDRLLGRLRPRMAGDFPPRFYREFCADTAGAKAADGYLPYLGAIFVHQTDRGFRDGRLVMEHRRPCILGGPAHGSRCGLNGQFVGFDRCSAMGGPDEGNPEIGPVFDAEHEHCHAGWLSPCARLRHLHKLSRLRQAVRADRDAKTAEADEHGNRTETPREAVCRNSGHCRPLPRSIAA